LALGALAVGLFAGPTSAQNGSNWHVLSNGLDAAYLGIGAGGTQVADVDGIGFWVDGTDLVGTTLTTLGDFGYHQAKFRLSECVFGQPIPGLRLDFPGIVVLEMDGRNSATPDVFVKPGCTTAGLIGLTTGGVIPYGTPPGSSANFLITGLPSGAGLSSSLACLIPNHGLLPSSNGGTTTLLAAASASLPIGSTGFCWVVQFTWTPTAVVSANNADGWWTWLTNSRDGNQYWGISNDELEAIQSLTIASDGGLNNLFAFFGGFEYEYHSASVDPVTNLALQPSGFNGTGVYYATNTTAAGSPINGGFDLGRRDAVVFNGVSLNLGGAVINPASGFQNQDPAGSPLGAQISAPTIGFVTWNNEVYTGPGAVVGGYRLTWVQFNWDQAFGVDQAAATTVPVFLGNARIPVSIPSSVPAPWPQTLTTVFWPFFIHNTSDQTGNSLWPDPSGFPGGTFGVAPTVGGSTHIPFVGFGPVCLGAPIAWGYGSTGLKGPGGPLTFRPDVNQTSTGRQVTVLD
jgi:hypothetical protein